MGRPAKIAMAAMVVVILLLVAADLVWNSETAQEGRARAVLGRHKAEALHCKELVNKSRGSTVEMAEALKAGNLQGAMRHLSATQGSLEPVAECYEKYNARLQEEFRAAGVKNPSVIRRTRARWEMENGISD